MGEACSTYRGEKGFIPKPEESDHPEYLRTRGIYVKIHHKEVCGLKCSSGQGQVEGFVGVVTNLRVQ